MKGLGQSLWIDCRRLSCGWEVGCGFCERLLVVKDINNVAFDDCTMLKLDIFGECFKEWFPVFLYDRFTEKIVILISLQEAEPILMVFMVVL